MATKQRLIIQMSGVPGAGKSTTAKLLAPIINAFIIDHDVLRTFFLDIDQPFNEAGRNAYRLQATLVEEMLRQGQNVIIDSTVNYQETLEVGLKLTDKYGYKYWYIECRVGMDDLELLDQRLKARTPLRSQRTGVAQPSQDAPNHSSEEEQESYFKKWITGPKRPSDEDLEIVVYSSVDDPKKCLQRVLERMGIGAAA